MQSFETLRTAKMRMARHRIEQMETTLLVLEDVEDIQGALPVLTLEEAKLEPVLAL